MSASFLSSERVGAPPFVNPYLQTLDRMQQRETLRPEQLTEWAQALLLERCGPSSRPVEAAFAHAALGLLAGHTHYFHGFAVLMPIQHGTAVAVRTSEAPRSQVTFEGSEERWSFDRADREDGRDRPAWPAWASIVETTVRRLAPDDVQVDAAVVSTIQADCTDAYLAALGVATARALQALFALPESPPELLHKIGPVMADCRGLPFSIAYAVAAEAGRVGHFVLVDTATGEQLSLEGPERDTLGWGLIDVGSESHFEASQDWAYKDKADKSLALLRQHGFAQLASLRDLEHRDLKRALGALPRRLKPVLRHLVTENRRVQKLVVAARRSDWQMFGTLLLMSHASLRDDWKRTDKEVDFVVEHVESMSLDGMYGACVTGRGGCVLVLGQPFVVPECLDRIQVAFEERFGRAPETLLL